MAKPINIDAYIAGFPEEIQTILEQARTAIIKAAPQAMETISYGMPAFKQNGMLVWMAAHTRHLGLYPRASAIEAFKKELTPYKSAKGSVQFPFDQPLPVALITKIVKYRLKENSEKMIAKKR